MGGDVLLKPYITCCMHLVCIELPDTIAILFHEKGKKPLKKAPQKARRASRPVPSRLGSQSGAWLCAVCISGGVA